MVEYIAFFLVRNERIVTLRENGSDTNSIFWCISSMTFMIIVSARYMVHNIGHTVIEFVTMQQKRVAQ